MSFYSEFAATPASVGDWEGEEMLAAEQVNRIYKAIDGAIPMTIDPNLARNIFNRVWEDWGYDLRLLDITDEEIQEYTINLLRTAA